MNRLLAAGLLCVMAAGCSKEPYVVTFDGLWAGTASAQGGDALIMVADFTWNEEKGYLSGTVDLDGWVYDLDSLSSDKDSATILLIHNVGARACTLVDAVQEDEAMSGGFEIDTCFSATLAGTTAGTGGANCITSGTFNLSRQ